MHSQRVTRRRHFEWPPLMLQAKSEMASHLKISFFVFSLSSQIFMLLSLSAQFFRIIAALLLSVYSLKKEHFSKKTVFKNNSLSVLLRNHSVLIEKSFHL